MFVSSSFSNSLSLRFPPPCTDLAGDPALLAATEPAGDLCAPNTGVAVLAREGVRRVVVGGRIVLLFVAILGRAGADILTFFCVCAAARRTIRNYVQALVKFKHTYKSSVYNLVTSCLPMREAWTARIRPCVRNAPASWQGPPMTPSSVSTQPLEPLVTDNTAFCVLTIRHQS